MRDRAQSSRSTRSTQSEPLKPGPLTDTMTGTSALVTDQVRFGAPASVVSQYAGPPGWPACCLIEFWSVNVKLHSDREERVGGGRDLLRSVVVVTCWTACRRGLTPHRGLRRRGRAFPRRSAAQGRARADTVVGVDSVVVVASVVVVVWSTLRLPPSCCRRSGSACRRAGRSRPRWPRPPRSSGCGNPRGPPGAAAAALGHAGGDEGRGHGRLGLGLDVGAEVGSRRHGPEPTRQHGSSRARRRWWPRRPGARPVRRPARGRRRRPRLRPRRLDGEGDRPRRRHR